MLMMTMMMMLMMRMLLMMMMMMMMLQDVFMGDEAVDLNCIARRHSLVDMTHEDNCITILYGNNLSDNRRLCLVAAER
jgi:hypothetical protein